MTITRMQVQQYGASLRGLSSKLRKVATRGLALGDVTGHAELQAWAKRVDEMAAQVDREQLQMAKLPKRVTG